MRVGAEEHAVPENGTEIDNSLAAPDGALGWWVICGEEPNIVPVMDIRAHVMGDECWCEPYADGEIVSHNSADGRERYQNEGARKH